MRAASCVAVGCWLLSLGTASREGIHPFTKYHSTVHTRRSCRQRYWRASTWLQIKVLNAIVRCRTAALSASLPSISLVSANSIPSPLAADPDRGPRTLETKRLAARGNQSIMR
jgi:hypothetical protein